MPERTIDIKKAKKYRWCFIKVDSIITDYNQSNYVRGCTQHIALF